MYFAPDTQTPTGQPIIPATQIRPVSPPPLLVPRSNGMQKPSSAIRARKPLADRHHDE